MKLIPLGINGYLPINGRHSSCLLALFDDAAFLLDAGTGAARLHEPAIQKHLAPYQELHVLLSHYHVDHTAGLYYAFTAGARVPLHIHAPVCPFIQADPVEAIRRYFQPPLNSYLLEDTTIRIHPINRPEFEIAGHRIHVWSQRHPGGSIGIRIDDALAYVTDTVVMMENVAYVRGVDVLLHELWLNDEDAAAQEKESQRHACLGPVAAFIHAAQPRRFMPVHLYPHYDDAMLARMLHTVRTRAGVPAELPEEGREILIG
ncbi:MAG TPA: MBL fold metallo-hydrolase [Kiritimatiellia bacterium]|nr:MBL fold metallo-hydrolase [Kiritimatiellia bacterium]HMO99708.1 MBL fold metallo-hydrolase [Kiritimatiellia bacterium]HMP97052.1 MBL fold metallo-hydrolase [Kiritimatiellia bacterium]